MIITSKKTPAQILELLADHKKVFLIGCGECATTCRTGGEDEVKEMAKFLAGAGKSVVGSVIIEAPCDRRLVKKDLDKQPKLREAEIVLVLACGSGTQVVASVTEKEVKPGLDTIALGKINTLRDIQAACRLCGNCQLDLLTSLYCPQNSCPKKLANGPCGGVREGKFCEVYPENDCVWVRIYDDLARKNRLPAIFKLQPPKNIAAAVFSQRTTEAK